MMKLNFRKLYSGHRPILEAIFWAILGILVVLFWPREPFMASATTIEAPSLVVIQQPISGILPEPTPIQVEEIPEILPEAISQPVEAPRYGFTADDIYLMAVLLTGSKDVDGDGEFDFDYGRQDEYDQISLVLCVVMNRVRSESFPNTVSEVIRQNNQFAPMRKWQNGLPEVSDISLQRVTEWCVAYDGYDPGIQSIPESHLYFTGDGRYNHSR